MTLEEAIEEVKRGKESGWVDSKTATAWDIIEDAVASGQLIPKADADLAVAEALRKAGDYVASCQTGGFYLWRHALPEDVLSLANQDHLAEVTALRAERDEDQGVIRVWRRRAEAAEAEVARLREALVEARDEAHSLAHNEYDGVWNEQDFANLTPLADAALTRKGEPT